jgi:hypothetical protein
MSIAYSGDAQHPIPGSSDGAIHSRGLFSQIPPRLTSNFKVERPNQEGWVTDSSGGLFYWVPHDYRAGLHSSALLTIPSTPPVSLQFDEFAFGKSWAQIFNAARP